MNLVYGHNVLVSVATRIVHYSHIKLHMFKYPLNGDLYIIAYIHMFKDKTYHLTIVIVAGWRSLSLFQWGNTDETRQSNFMFFVHQIKVAIFNTQYCVAYNQFVCIF